MAFRGGAKDESLSESVWVSLNTNFLTVADDIVRAKDVRFLNSHNFEDSTVDRTDALVRSRCQHVSLISTPTLVISVNSKPSVSLLTLQHKTVARADLSVCRERPGNLFVVHLMYFIRGLGGHLTISSLSLVVGLSVEQNKNRHTNVEIAMK